MSLTALILSGFSSKRSLAVNKCSLCDSSLYLPRKAFPCKKLGGSIPAIESVVGAKSTKLKNLFLSIISFLPFGNFTKNGTFVPGKLVSWDEAINAWIYLFDGEI